MKQVVEFMRDIRERRPTQDGHGFRTVTTGREMVTVEVDIDVNGLLSRDATIGGKIHAGKNKATLSQGCIVAKVVNRRATP